MYTFHRGEESICELYSSQSTQLNPIVRKGINCKSKQRKHSIRLWRKTSVLRQPIDSCHVDNRSNPSPNRQKAHAIHLRQKPSDKSSRHSPLLPLLPSLRTSIATTQIAEVEPFRRRKSSRRALCFHLWGCAVLCLPKIPPHHIT